MDTKKISFDFWGKHLEVWETIFCITDGKIQIKNGPYDEFALWGAYASGKTFLVLLIIHIICSNYPNVNCVLIRETYSQLDDTIIADFNKMFLRGGYTYKEGKKEVHYPNGSIIRFRAFDVPEKILGGNIDLIVVSQAEQIPGDLFNELFGRLRGKSSLPKKLIITEGNPSEGWAKRRYVTNPLPPNVYYKHFTTYDNEKVLSKISPNFIDRMIANLPENQIKRMVYGSWDTLEDSVFSSFVESINVIDPFEIPKNYEIAIGIDYGFRNPTAIIWAAVDYDDNIIIFDEFYEPGKMIPEIAFETSRHGSFIHIIDFSTKRPDRDGKSVWSELENLGLPLLPSNKDELRNITFANMRFKKMTLFITRNCVNLIREIREYRWQKVTITSNIRPKEKPIDKNNHAIDAMLYVIAYIEDLKSESPESIKNRNSIVTKLSLNEGRKSSEDLKYL